MATIKHRLWSIVAENGHAFDRQLLDDVFGGTNYTLVSDAKVQVKLPANTFTPNELQNLLEQDAMAKISLTRGPLCHNQESLEKSKEMIDEISKLSKSLYPEQLSHTFESCAQYFDKKVLALYLAPILNDKEMYETVICFCENNLNATATAEKLYLHRNTLLYRLDKIEQANGFNLKSFIEVANLYYSLKKIK